MNDIASLRPPGAVLDARPCVVAACAGRNLDAGDVAALGDHLAVLFAAPDLPARMDAWLDLVAWTRRSPGGLVTLAAGGRLSRVATERLDLLLDCLEASGELLAATHDAVAAMLAETRGANLFGEAGIPSDRGFFAELVDRMMSKLVPAPRDDHDLARLLRRQYATPEEVERFRRLPAPLFERLARVVLPCDRPGAMETLRCGFADGFRLLASRVETEGLTSRVRERCTPGPVAQSPFYLLERAGDDVLAVWTGGGDVGPPAARWREVCAAVRRETARVGASLEGQGVSVDLVFALDVIDRCTARMEAMVDLMCTPPGPARVTALHGLLADLIVASHRDRSARALLGANLRLIGRRIVDRAGATGEHYVAADRREYRRMWALAAGGGLLTVGTAAVKLQIVGAQVAPFVEGLLAGLNYAASFLLLQAFHLILATKQPAMTAAALAGIMRDRSGPDRAERIVDYAARISHSQLAAAIANVTFVAAGAFLFDRLWRLATGAPYLDAATAQYALTSLSPVDTGTVFYAALTGVLLWSAAVIGGWIDNWSAVRRLPQAIREHPVGRRYGRERMARFADLWARNVSGWGTNVSLGLLLGMTPVVGHFLGLPLDVRHVTLSSGILAFGAAAGGGGTMTAAVLAWACVGVATMFVLNLSVSFLCSLGMAARAYGFAPGDLRALGRAWLARLRRRPLEFIVPAGNGTPPDRA